MHARAIFYFLFLVWVHKYITAFWHFISLLRFSLIQMTTVFLFTLLILSNVRSHNMLKYTYTCVSVFCTSMFLRFVSFWFLRYVRDLLLNPPAYDISSTIQGELWYTICIGPALDYRIQNDFFHNASFLTLVVNKMANFSPDCYTVSCPYLL